VTNILAPAYVRHELIDKKIEEQKSMEIAREALEDPCVQEVDLGYIPRKFQEVLHASMRRFNVLVCHRRFGKTVFCIMELVDRGLGCEHRNPQVAYIAPTYAQAKRVAWQYILDFTRKFPGVIVNKSELSVKLPRPHLDDHVTIWLLGADNPDSLRGIYLDWCVLDEYAQCHPMIWGEIIRPALSDRKGGAIFIGTPKGQNHFHKIFRAATDLMDDGNPNWFAQMYKASDTGVVDEEELMDARATMTEEEYAQEYECSFTAALLGSYYGRYLVELDKKGRIRDFDYDVASPVRTYWDLGISDSTSIWFVQSVGSEIRIIDYLENSGVGLEWYVKAVRDKPYIYDHAGHGIPHDGAARELGTGKSRQETLRELGLLSHVVPRQSIADGIHAARMMMQKNIWFNKTKCAKGIEALRNYQRKWDGKNSMFVDKPLHNWASNGADAFRYLSLDLDAPGERMEFRNLQKIKHNIDYNELEF
jgi:hypothetical protein